MGIKIRVLQTDIVVTLVREGASVRVLMSAGGVLLSNSSMLRQAVETIRSEVLAVLCRGTPTEWYVRTQSGWYECVPEGGVRGAKSVRVLPLREDSPRVTKMVQALESKKAYAHMEAWLEKQLAEPVL